MKIVVFGATGNIGQRIIQEALNRGHEVKGVARRPEHFTLSHPRLSFEAGNVLDPADVARLVRGYDVVISAVGPARDREEDPRMVVQAAQALIEGLKRAGVKRLVVVGGAGSLEVAPGVRLMDTPDFPPGWRPIASAAAEALEIYRQQGADLDWTYFSPAAFIEPGQRTGRYRVGTEQLVTNEKGESRISMEDYAVALLDEVEQPRFVRQRFTVAY
ncbi:MAG: NAD(P)-dependent oxidoreductase [Thermogemmatispora sp.]|uniref:NAD(P)-dependent oxidoreductase n=1 Tax=Thermogemmatispora sp. TaxID=1968838 RepID=UPI0026327B88|nr:NAD(P)-dependent oxidoreductase [Thermogemmatispora sp.]MBX5455540.1 NAD(P)-dependent oxidoreductase [Thermogemmatispora sp.]